ncbi:putative FecCD-family membrane transport protein [Actinoplanes missouriensis 431]|uniref:Putative FecCD-family membrane transport protein n=1 Tax=Actinoplanes missouriensis (strain ATCC 14538 / DSM 43046 / CBS 188.64 / JCM 3121 / NBRC 102363 / NCIMB 12654 / NRRL B-3342 / UNCC 431) TaxID=512565 RepID=I0HBX2_ACTM4|nr:iron ABC transporter permease [Actinoplanes missouriensis]BAL90509.1 putative FecCD-family membrane transport protein [Actinoplanes missouriensis 431]
MTAGALTRTGRGSRLTALAGLLLLAGVAVLLSLGLGAQTLHPSDVWQALVHPDGSDATAVVRELRGPRTLLGVLVGLALGAAGALMQGHTRNPIADPGLLGVSAGASFAVVVAIAFLGITHFQGYVYFAFAGSLGASVLVFALGRAGAGGPTPVTLALAGMALSALLASFTSSILISDPETLSVFRFWVVGSLAGRDWATAWAVLPFIAAGLVVAAVNAPALNALGLGEDVARALGQNVAAARTVGVAAIVLLAGAATAAAGPLAFAGLIVPHIARLITGPDHRWLIPFSALLGVSLILVADVVGRLIASPAELQTGIVLAFVGAPFFIWLVRRIRMVRL